MPDVFLKGNTEEMGLLIPCTRWVFHNFLKEKIVLNRISGTEKVNILLILLHCYQTIDFEIIFLKLSLNQDFI